MRLLLGVVVGVVAGEITVAALGGGYGSLALAVFAATAVARALGGARIVIAQAAAGAILTVAVANGEAGTQRLVDALIGVGVALLFTQVLFSPEPLALLRRAEAAALADMAEALHLTAQALEHDDDDVAEKAMSHLRTLPLVRTAMATDQACRRQLAPHTHTLADALGDLARAPGERSRRQEAADRALDVARRLAATDTPSDAEAVAAIVALRTVASDLMAFAGVDAEQAEAAVRDRDW